MNRCREVRSFGALLCQTEMRSCCFVCLQMAGIIVAGVTGWAGLSETGPTTTVQFSSLRSSDSKRHKISSQKKTKTILGMMTAVMLVADRLSSKTLAYIRSQENHRLSLGSFFSSNSSNPASLWSVAYRAANGHAASAYRLND